MFKVNNENIKTTSVTSFLCLIFIKIFLFVVVLSLSLKKMLDGLVLFPLRWYIFQDHQIYHLHLSFLQVFHRHLFLQV